MRNQEAYDILQQIEIEKDVHFFPEVGTVTDIYKLHQQIENIRLIPGFESSFPIWSIYGLWKDAKATQRISLDSWQKLHAEITLSKVKLSGLRAYIQSVIKKQADNTLYVRAPDTRDLTESGKFLVELDVLLKQLILQPEIGGTVEIDSCEPGSIWYHICLGSTVAVALVGSLAWAAAVVYKKIQEGRIIAEHVKSLKIKNESLEDLQKGQSDLIELLVDTEARNIIAEYLPQANPENPMRVSRAIKEFAKMIERGAQIHPSLSAPENVRNLFPNFAKLSTIESKTKLLAEHNKE